LSPPGLTFPLVPRRQIAGVAYGEMRSRRRGRGYDVAGSRPYAPGDDIRLIDRHASARLSTARGSDEFVIRVHDAEETTRVVLVVDRRPSMTLFPDEFPWLHKRVALTLAGRMIIDSALQARALVSLMDADGESRIHQAPRGRAESWLLEEQLTEGATFTAPAGALSVAFEELARTSRLPAGAFVFVISDFLDPPGPAAWQAAISRRWELVPVVIQDPLWEQSFPDVSGATIPISDPVSGRVQAVRLTGREVRARREANEARLAGLLSGFVDLELDAVVLSTERTEEIFEAFVVWAEARRWARWVR
jgi:uncharacterized protein (DUF58 family)